MEKKFAITMPKPLFKEMERSRLHAKDRSAWIQEAVAERLKRERHEADVAAYIRGYQLYPETEDELAEEWPEAPH